MIRSLYRTGAGEFRTDLKSDEINAALSHAGGLLWLDFAGGPPEACEPPVGWKNLIRPGKQPQAASR